MHAPPVPEAHGQAHAPVTRPCRDDERATILDIINAAAVAYAGVIPADCWHEPYMSTRELAAEIEAGVRFSVCTVDGTPVGVMGLQAVHDLHLIRHAYVLPQHQRRGIGAALMDALRAQTHGLLLVGTWRAADWAIRFYERHGFVRVPGPDTERLLRRHWSVSDRQIAVSVVLASPAPGGDEVSHV